MSRRARAFAAATAAKRITLAPDAEPYSEPICPECGERGAHWVVLTPELVPLWQDISENGGFWTCDKFYGADGRRISE